MFGRIFGKKGEDGETKATRANMGQESTMYYDKEKGRWRERGKEHLEEEEEKLAPPPMMGASKETTEGEKPDSPPAADAPKQEATGLDALMAPPSNPYANRLRNKSASTTPKTSLMPPIGAFGPPPTPAAPPGEVVDDTSGPSDNADNRTDGVADQAAGGGGAANPFAASATVTANPFAPRSQANTPAFNPNAPAALRNPHMPRSMGGGEPAPRKARPKPERTPRTYAPVPMPFVPPTEPVDPEGMTTDDPVLNKPQPAFPNQDAAPLAPEPPLPELPQTSEPALPQPPEPEQQPLPEVSNAGDESPRFGGDSPVEQTLPAFGSVPEEIPASAEEQTLPAFGSVPDEVPASAEDQTLPAFGSVPDEVPASAEEQTLPAIGSVPDEVPASAEEPTLEDAPAAPASKEDADKDGWGDIGDFDEADEPHPEKPQDAPPPEEEAEKSGEDAGAVEAEVRLEQQGTPVASKAPEFGQSNGDSNSSWVLLQGEDASRTNAGQPPSIIESVPVLEEEAAEAVVEADAAHEEKVTPDDAAAPEDVVPNAQVAEVKEDQEETKAHGEEAKSELDAWMDEASSGLAKAEVKEDQEETKTHGEEAKGEGLDAWMDEVSSGLAKAEAKEEQEETKADGEAVQGEGLDAWMAEVSTGLAVAEEQQEETKAHDDAVKEEGGFDAWMPETSGGLTIAEEEAKPDDAAETEGKAHDGSVGLTIPEEESKLDGGATAQEEDINAFVTDVSEPVQPEEVTRDLAPVPEVPEEATRDIAPPQESKSDPDLSAEAEELTKWMDEISVPKPSEQEATDNAEDVTKWMDEISGPKPSEHEASSTIGEPPAVPAARSTANGPAWSSMADGDTTDDAAGAEGVGPNGANFASSNPMLHIAEVEEERDTMAWLAESPANTAAEPVETEAPTQLNALEAEFAAVRARAADLERELEEAKRRASEREEQLVAVQKAQEDRIQQMVAEAAERTDQFQATHKAQEERLHKAEAEVAELRDQLQAERSRSAAAAEAAATTAVSTATPSLAEDSELPDFVQSCGNSEVIVFARRLASDNAALRRQQQQPQPLQQQAVSTSAKEAIANGVAESDGHQIAPLLALLQENHSDLQTSMKVCVALETLTFNTSENRVIVVKHGGLKALVDLLDEHKDAPGTVLRPAVDALWNLTFEEVAVDAATEVGAIERIAALMQSHCGEASLIAGACAVLLNLAVREQNRWKIVESGSVGLMASAMQQHPENEELMELGSQALYMLAYHQDLKPVVLAARGSEAAALAAACPHGAGKAQMWGRWLQEVLAC